MKLDWNVKFHVDHQRFVQACRIRLSAAYIMLYRKFLPIKAHEYNPLLFIIHSMESDLQL